MDQVREYLSIRKHEQMSARVKIQRRMWQSLMHVAHTLGKGDADVETAGQVNRPVNLRQAVAAIGTFTRL